MTIYCSQHAQETGVPLYGTASEAQVWFLLEYSGVWQAKALQDNDLSPAVQAWLDTQTTAIPNSRALFIKRDQTAATKSFYIAVTDLSSPQLYRFQVQGYEELLSLDVAAIVFGDTDEKPAEETLVLVCTNGKRDRCCAKFGLPVYQTFAAKTDFSVWQSTHLGGHRYSATAAIFPAGIYYGYVSPAQVDQIVQAIRSHNIYLPGYRGRTFYDGVVSAADYFVRQATNETRVSALPIVAKQEIEAIWQVQFTDDDNDIHTIELTQTKSEPVLASCDKPLKPQPQFQFLRHIL